MKVTADTNILVRAFLRDDPVTSELAISLLGSATNIALPLPILCELVWVLNRTHKIDKSSIADLIEKLLNSPNVLCDRTVVEFGIQFLRNGGDFADGVIAYEGKRMGGDTFVSFDKKAVTLLEKQGKKALLLK